MSRPLIGFEISRDGARVVLFIRAPERRVMLALTGGAAGALAANLRAMADSDEDGSVEFFLRGEIE